MPELLVSEASPLQFPPVDFPQLRAVDSMDYELSGDFSETSDDPHHDEREISSHPDGTFLQSGVDIICTISNPLAETTPPCKPKFYGSPSDKSTLNGTLEDIATPRAQSLSNSQSVNMDIKPPVHEQCPSIPHTSSSANSRCLPCLSSVFFLSL